MSMGLIFESSPTNYIYQLKERLVAVGNETATNCRRLKMLANENNEEG